MAFKIGDRVKRKVNCGEILQGHTGTVYAVFERAADDYQQLHITWDHLPNEMDVCFYLALNFELIQTQAERNKEIDIALHNATKPTNPKDRAATHRLDLTVFPETATIFGALAMTEGDCKYGGYNYRSAGVGVNTYVAALKRHVGKYYDRGEWADAKTGVPHLANALACIAVLIDGHCKGNITDDRPPRMEADLYTWAEALTKSLHEMFPEGVDRFTETKDGNKDGSVPDWLTPKP